MTLQVGAILYGYCGGGFGRDSYGIKRVEAVGVDWVVARELREDGGLCFADLSGMSVENKEVLFIEWTTKPAAEDDF